MSQEFNIVGNLLLKVDNAESGINKLKNSLSKLEIPKGLENSLNKSFSNLDSIFERYRKQLSKGFETKSDVSNITKIGKELDSELTKVSNHLTKLTGEKIDFKVDTEPVKKAALDLEEILEKRRQLTQEKAEIKIETQKEGITNLKQLLEEFQRVAGDTKAGRAVGQALSHIETGDLEKAVSFLKEAENNLTRIGTKKREAFGATGFTLEGALEDIIKKLSQTDNEFTTVNDKAKLFQEVLTQAQAGQLKDVDALLAKLTQGFEKNASGAREAAKAAQDYAQSTVSMKDQVKQLQQSTQYFFSLRNMINLFKRGVREAVDTVKELDKAMTATAVVTKFDVSDMWAKLPEYTANANALGATVQDMYESTTLYYQQGLNAQQAMSIATETMKMARIAGMEAADATDMMTAALRGFNMEINETSAERINDVYSNLAAKTASNTQELGTAMQRTASIAHSAGMSFEGTAAFLAQAIETTREPAENLGTAMKTIIARFQELKKNPLEMTEVDGEEVSYNKVDDALKTIGVDLKDTNGQFRDLDKVFLDIAQRWDGLSQTQQRYIATTAAGSRQQSRFIAMMSDYERTMELMGYANDSAGASTNQFNKTLDSLEAKINKFQNAWKQFLMGIMNDKWTKRIVDAGTGVLNIVNKIIDTLSFGGKAGLLKSVLSTFTAFTALRFAGKGANMLIGGLGGMVDPRSNFRAGAQTGMIGRNSAAAINQPIVKELQSIRSLLAQKINQSNLGKNTTVGPYDEYNRLKAARTAIGQIGTKETSVKDLTKQLNGLSASSQNALMRGYSATFQAATGAIINSYGGKNAKEIGKGAKFLNAQRKSGEITAQEYYKALQDPGLLKQAMLKAGVSKDNAAFQYIDGLDKQITEAASKITQDRKAMRMEAFERANPNATAEEKQAYAKKLDARYSSGKWQEAVRQKATEDAKGEPITFKTSKIGLAVQKIGEFGLGISQAGMGLQSFGSILASSANPALQMFGSMLTSIGGLISGIGMGISGLSAGFTALSGSTFVTTIATELLGATETTLAAKSALVAGALGVLVLAIAGAALWIKKHNEKIKEAAEEVQTKYQEKNDKAQTNISNLQSWKEDFARLIGGVDANGNNVSLSTEDYDRYLEIARGIAEINPSIVEGYNAQGQAIITNNKALEETLELEKQHQAEAFQEYTSPESLKKLLAARDLSKQAKTIEGETTYSYYGGKVTQKQQTVTGEVEFKPQGKMRKEAQRIGRLLQEGVADGWADSQALKDEFNLDINDLAAGNEEALQIFDQLGPKIQQRINDSMDSAGDDIKESTKNSMLEAFSGYSDASEELDELITPTYNYLLASSSQYASKIPTEFKKYFNQGLKEIASDANITDIDKAAHDLADGFSILSDEGGDYYDVLKDINDAQLDYAQTLDKDTYDAFAEGAVDRLNKIRDTLGEQIDLTQGYGKAIDEFIQNEIDKVTKFTQEGGVNLQHALNTMVDQISAAEGALENFNKIAEGTTYGKAASNMSQIYETATADEHKEGEGDQVFWAGAEAIVGRKNLLENGKATKESALKQMEEIQEMLKGGQEGWDNFKIKWFDNADANMKVLEDGSRRLLDENGKVIEGLTLKDSGWIDVIDENLNPEVYDQIADALDMSKESLIAMLNLGRQFGDLDFYNIDDVQKALATSESTIKNSENGQIFARKSSFEAEMTQAGIDLNKQQDIEDQLTSRNLHFIEEDLNKITKDNEQFTQMGITDIESLVKTFDDTGQFTKDEIAGYAGKYAELFNVDNWENAFNEAWNQNQADQEYGGIPSSLGDIKSLLASIDGHLADQRLSQGYLDNATADEAKQWMHGGEGDDTSVEKFRKGQGSGENGQITESEFNKTSKDLNDFINKSTEYVGKLEEAKKEAIKNKDYTEVGEIERERLAYKGMIEDATTYLKEGTEAYQNQSPTTSTGTEVTKPTFDDPAIQAAADQVFAAGWGNLLSNVSPDTLNTPEAQQAMATLASTTFDPNMMKSPELTQALMDLGLTYEQAIQAGMDAWPNGDEVGAEAEDKAAETGDQITEGSKAGIDKTDTSGVGDATESKTKDIVEDAAQGAVDGANKASTPTSSTSTPSTPSASTPSASTTTPSSSTPTTIEVDTTQVDEATQKITELTNTLSQGADFVINVDGVDSLNQAATAASQISSNAGAQTVGVKTSFDSSAATAGVASINAMSAKIKVGADTSGALTQAENTRRVIDNKTATVDISANFKGSWSHDVDITVYKKTVELPHTGGLISYSGLLYRARGGLASNPMFKRQGTDTIPAMLTPGEYIHNRDAVSYFGIDFMRKINHKDLTGALQSFGSAAKGRYGRLGPNGKGGLTLTGEEGFEVAWIPSENRSMILGANGPQMTNLPSDTIVWNHKQSKKIVSQGVIPAGSHRVEGKDAEDPRKKQDGGGGGGGGTPPKPKPKPKDTKEQEKLVSKAGKVIVWWENQEHKIDAVLRKVDKSQKAFDKILKKASTTIEEVRAAAQTTIKDLQQSIQVNTQAKKRAQAELEAADKGTTEQQKANKELKAAKKSKNKKRIKKAKQAVKKANAKAVALGTSAEISYEEGSGKKKKTTKQNINLSKYIKYDKKTGAYVIDQAAINKVAKKNKSKADAIKNAANQVINDKQGKLNKAEDNIDKAKEQIDEIGQQIYDTFFSWRNELTKVYDLTQKLEATEKRRANLESGKGLIDAQIAAGKIGLDNAKAMSDQLFKGQIAATQASIKMGAEKIEAQKAEIKRADLNDDNQAVRRDISNQVSSINTILDNEKKYEDAKKKKNKFEKDEKEIKAAAKLAKGKSTTNVTKKELKAAKKDEQDRLKALKKQLKGTKDKKKRKKLEDKIAKAEKNIKTLTAGINAKSTYRDDKKAWNAVEKNYKSEYNISDNEVANLKARKEELNAENRALNEEHATKEKARQYSKVSYNDDGTVNLEIDYDKIEADRVAGKITSAEADEIKEYLERIQEENNNLLDAYNEQTTRLTELYQSLADLKQQQADHAKELFDQYVENQRQTVENTKQLSDVISSSTKDLLDGVKNKLDERRKQEDNKKTEQDISKKQQRLAALRADTSGGHQVEIAQLQKEIGEAQESYSRTLEDQLLDSLNKQNDTAQKQREQQIALAEKQVELNTKNGIYAAHIDYLLENANSKSAAEEMRALWEQITGVEGLPAIIQETIQAQIDANMLDVQSFNDRYKILSDTIDGLSSYVDALQQALSDTASSLGTFAAGLNGESGPVLAEGAGRKYQTDSKKAGDEKTAQEIQEEVNEQNYKQSTMGHVVATATHSGGKTENGQIDTSGTKLGVARGSTLEIYKWDATNGVQGEFSSRKTIDKLTAKDFDEYPIEAKEALKYAIENQKPGTLINKKIDELVAKASIVGKTFKLKNGIYGSVSNKGKIYYNDGKKGVQIWDTSKGNLKLDKYNKAEFKRKASEYKNVGREYAQVLKKRGVPGYATGGLADYTGPAWLDGTPSKPELVLNARDTQNFIALKDVLAKAMSGIEDVPASYGDILYEININVDKIEKDYDVDKVVDKVKKEIVKTSGYRNVTQVRNLR